jgi:hypothetical protein
MLAGRGLDANEGSYKSHAPVLPYEEFIAIKERQNDGDDLLELRKAKRVEGTKNRFLWPRLSGS